MNTDIIKEIAPLWASAEGKPYKGGLIDWEAYTKDPSDIGCMCAQGQVLHRFDGWTPEMLRDPEGGQHAVDKRLAELLDISIAHSVLLRIVNDTVDGAPLTVLTKPELIIGDQAETLLAFWHHIDAMTPTDWVNLNAAWDAARNTARNTAGNTARNAARNAAGNAAWDAARNTAWDTAGNAAWDTAWDTARNAAGNAAWDAARNTAWDTAGNAAAEIQGGELMSQRGQPFFFLPMFGFENPAAILEQTK